MWAGYMGLGFNRVKKHDALSSGFLVIKSYITCNPQIPHCNISFGNFIEQSCGLSTKGSYSN